MLRRNQTAIVMNVKVLLAAIFLIVATATISAQPKIIKVNNQSLTIQTRKVNNEWNTKDEISELYILKNGKRQLVLAYYPYKDEGGDCNNLFWTKEKLTVKNNTLVITTRHFQKTGRDPITEWEKKTFTVHKNGEVELTEQLYKKYGSNQWLTEEPL